MITYFIKSGLCLALLLAFYHLVLEREKMHTFNRFYLLGSVLFSFLAPLYVIYKYVPVITENFTPIIIDNGFTPEQTTVETPFNAIPFLIGLYVSISLLLFIRFCKNLFLIIQKIRKNRHIKLENATIVLVEDTISPHTFLSYIFINTNEYFSEKIENELLTHELTHVTQKHTIDILLIEFLQVLFWINPTFILLKKAVKLNHEFLADNKVINTYKNTTEYQYLLLNRATWNNEYYLASNLNYLLTKKRLQMMTKQSSRTKILLKKLTVIPLLVGFVFLFAQRVEAQEKADPKIVAEYNKLAKKYNNQEKKQIIKLNEVQRMEELYSKLNNTQKLNAEKYPDLPPPPPTPPKPIKVKKGVKYKGDVPPPPSPPKPNKNKTLSKRAVREVFVEEIVEDNNNTNNNNEEFGGVIFEEGHAPKPKTGWTVVDGKTIYYAKYNNKTEYFDRFGNPIDFKGNAINTTNENKGKIVRNGKLLFYTKKDGKTYYYNQKGQQVDKNGNFLKHTTSYNDSIPTKTGLEQVGRKVYAYKIFNSKKYYFDRNSGKQTSVKHSEPEDYFEMQKRMKKTKKIFYLDDKLISKSEFLKLKKSKEKYHFGITFNKNKTVMKLHASKSQLKINELLKGSKS